MLTVVALNQNHVEGTGQFSKTGKINKWYKNHKGRNKFIIICYNCLNRKSKGIYRKI